MMRILKAVVEGVRTFGYYNAGQDCTAACRIYAQKGIYDTLVEKLGAAVATLKSGAPDDESTDAWTFKLAGASRTRQQGSRRGRKRQGTSK
ncbi:gamma-aminobutyraldehyde dehydrogenase [Escherichia coli]|uniref:Gamma-aminobutyraldehyde dehydrogenase n=1 Tax=Escherichia coli TaxID=562 RepID=A0A2X1KJP3_ECOLX|nr:gamma-aminobutyraldehyde dehydrogenase [Escherichia coli]